MKHIPVLAKEVMEGLAIQSGERVLDATVGLGGHAALLLEATAPEGALVGFDRDDRNLELARERLESYGERVQLIHDSFANLAGYDLLPFDAALFDLGYSSVHVDDAQRGFSFSNDGPLDMRYDTRQELTAEQIVNSWSREDLSELFRTLGDEKRAEVIAKAIFEARRKERITRTGQLADVIAGKVRRIGKTHPATQTFQALRMAVNDELGEIERGLDAVTTLLKPGGRLAVITFHSIEDRLVKQSINADERLEKINKKVIKPTFKETRTNPRARSAKLRLARKI